jgi:hypothetical protein
MLLDDAGGKCNLEGSNARNCNRGTTGSRAFRDILLCHQTYREGPRNTYFQVPSIDIPVEYSSYVRVEYVLVLGLWINKRSRIVLCVATCAAHLLTSFEIDAHFRRRKDGKNTYITTPIVAGGWITLTCSHSKDRHLVVIATTAVEHHHGVELLHGRWLRAFRHRQLSWRV